MKIETHEMVKEFETHTNGCHYKIIVNTDTKETYIDYGCNHLINLQIDAGEYLQGFLGKNKDRPVNIKGLPLLEDWQRVKLKLLEIPPCECCGGVQYMNNEKFEGLNQERVKNYRW